MRSRASISLIVAFLLLVFTVQINPAFSAILYDNGPLINGLGTGVGGADESILQSISLGMSTIAFGHEVSSDNRVSDDFTISDANGWDVTTITFYAYQTDSSTTSTITHVIVRIWDGPPAQPGSTVVFGDTTTNLLTNTLWSGIYRVTETTTGTATSRPIMANIVNVNMHLDQGTYWLDWQTGGTLPSGPWAPPITINGQPSTGDGLQSLDAGVTYNAALDDGSGTPPQGFPFIVEGAVTASSSSIVPALGILLLF